MSLSAFGLNCTLTPSPSPSSTQLLLDQVLAALARHGITVDSTRVVDHDVKPGVRADEGDGDAWPRIRQRILDANILVVATPVWLGQPSSVAKRVLERLNAFLGEIDEDGCNPTFGRVATVAVVGNEDGAHHVIAELDQGLADVGFTLPAAGATYWVGEAMQKTDYKDLAETPEKTASTTATLASNAAHLARLLRERPYPPPKPG